MLVTDATNLPRLMQCIGSRLLPNSEAPNESNREQIEEGNAAHWVIEQSVLDHEAVLKHENQPAPNGVLVTPSMCEHVADYLNAIKRDGCVEYFEHVTTFEGPNWRIDARADHIAWNEATKTLYVDDFKYGWRIVSPENNWTLIAHALGFRFNHQIDPERIVLTIHQPRPFHNDGMSREWVIDRGELSTLYGRIWNVLGEQADSTRTGPACHYCPKIAGCRAAAIAGYNAVDVADRAVEDSMSNERLSFELDQMQRAIDMAKDRLGALQNLATHRLKQGAVINNYQLSQSLGNRRWNEGLTPEIVNAFTGKIVASMKFISPAQAEKAGVSKTVLDTLTHRPMSSVKLERVSTHEKAKRIFGKKG